MLSSAQFPFVPNYLKSNTSYSPKSANFNSPISLISKFCGLRSLWNEGLNFCFKFNAIKIKMNNFNISKINVFCSTNATSSEFYIVILYDDQTSVTENICLNKKSMQTFFRLRF